MAHAPHLPIGFQVPVENSGPFAMNQSRRIHVRNFNSWIRPALKALDMLAIVCGLFVLITLMPDANSKSTIVIGLVAIGIFSVMAELLGLYRNWQGVSFNRQASCHLLSWTASVLVLILLGQFTEYSTELSGRGLLFWYTVTPIFTVGFRTLFRLSVFWLAEVAGTNRGFAVIGANPLGVELVRGIRQQTDLGLKFMGFVDDRPAGRSESLPADMNERIGNLEQLVKMAALGKSPSFLSLCRCVPKKEFARSSTSWPIRRAASTSYLTCSCSS